MEKEAIKSLIELAETFDEANDIIESCTQFRATNEKLAYLFDMFDVNIVASTGKDDVESDYVSVLTAVIKQKWR